MSLIKSGLLTSQAKYILVASLLMLLSLSGCEKTTTKTAVSVNSNAYYTVYQEANGANWQTRLASWANVTYRPITISFTVPDKSSPYGIVFACPSSNGNKPHEVFVFYATPAEMDVIDFSCKKATDDIVQRPVYGKIAGLNISSSANPLAEQARISFSKEVTINAWEAFATMLRSGARDAVGFKGEQRPGQLLEPKMFYINRNATTGASSDAQRIDISFDENDFKGYVAPFDLADTSNVNVGGVSAGEIFEGTVGFLSDNQSLLTLVESNSASFAFVPVPLKNYSGNATGFINSDEFNPGEGHELIVQTRDGEGLPLRRVSKFFTLSSGEDHNVFLPKAVSPMPIIGSRNRGELQEPLLNWSAYTDAGAGSTRLYRWRFKGNAADPKADKPALVNVAEVDWVVYVTPGWLNVANGETQNYSMLIPSEFPVSVEVKKNEYAYTWRQEWGLKASNELRWEFTAFVVGDKFTAKDVIEYNLNRKFDILEEDSSGSYNARDFVFGESYARATLLP